MEPEKTKPTVNGKDIATPRIVRKRMGERDGGKRENVGVSVIYSENRGVHREVGLRGKRPSKRTKRRDVVALHTSRSRTNETS